MPQAYAPLGRLAMTGLGTADAEMPEQADLMAPVTATTPAAASHFDSPSQKRKVRVGGYRGQLLTLC